MSVLCDYFLAATDEQAAATLDWEGGPSKPPTAELAARTTVSLPGLEPIVMLSTFQELLTGRSFDELLDENGQDVGFRNDGELIVIRISEALQKTLAESSPDDLRKVSGPWSETEEFYGQTTPQVAEAALVQLAELARTGVGTKQRLYCWICV